MKKTITVNLGGVIYNIEEDAYQRLDSYLSSIRAYFASSDEKESGDEIVGDIESRAAETFSGRKIVTIKDIESLISSMGTVDDIAGAHTSTEGTTEQKHRDEKGTKRLFRDTDNSMVAGVCSGIAAYFGIDPTLIRLVFALSLLFGGAGIIVYIILWLVVPEAKSVTEKMEMKGEQVTLSGLKEKVNSKIEEMDRGRFQSKVRSFSRGVGTVIKGIIPILLKIVGVLIVIVSALAIAGVTVSIVTVFSGAHGLFLDFPIREYFSGISLITLLISTAVVTIIPLTLLISLGTTLIHRKSSFNLVRFLSSFVLWVIALSILAFMAVQILPVFETRQLSENAPLVMREYSLSGFTNIHNTGTVSVDITQGEVFKVTATGSEIDFSRFISLTQKDDTLYIKNVSRRGLCLMCLIRTPAPSVSIVMPQLNDVYSSGAPKTNITGFDDQDLYAHIHGASRFTYSGNANSINLDSDGAPRTTLTGSAGLVTAKLDGASQLTANNLIADDVHITLDGASSASVHAQETLDVESDGVSSLFYYGNPTVTQKRSGMSHIEKLETATSTIVQ
ncbi:MAG: PspC domain-containing protein [Candidatus Taylorbacteria bacterium]|nr:PspC domain-containing protein [Candidatus Taylorbacteria bacterium]